MRIAHISDCYAPRTGGIESQVAALAKRQSAAGHSVRVITATPAASTAASAPGTQPDVVDGIVVDRLVAGMPFDLPVHPRTRREVGRALAREHVDIVHVHAGVISPFAWGAVKAARDRGLPVLITVHSVWGPLARPAFGISDALVHWSGWDVAISAVSTLAAAQIRAAVPALEEVHVTPNGIDPDQWIVDFAPAIGQRMQVVSVMRLAPRKRVVPLIRAVAQARHEMAGAVDITATIVGDGPDRERAERFARRHGVSSAVRFTGRLDRAGIRSVFAGADVYVQPSVRESFGLAALEARTAGLPVVVRAQSGSTEFIHDGVEGCVVEDDAAMARALVELAMDPARRERLRAHNRTTQPQETWNHVLSAVDAAYRAAGATGF